ncbi:hypothetical protein CKC_04040 [Candidatus Liberibacter solanacearum CLso-ZC1]|uniref:Uncharacterized protein n=1 Tax=Liberibacter solanacearum (strain CLso-ZC1) TaxID=658172 RepID=E4UB78_LIBSC|nr:hypothetical protein CKC_04040 [Candidatus Liberibacter solanacearum CLso-ZC1]
MQNNCSLRLFGDCFEALFENYDSQWDVDTLVRCLNSHLREVCDDEETWEADDWNDDYIYGKRQLKILISRMQSLLEKLKDQSSKASSGEKTS